MLHTKIFACCFVFILQYGISLLCSYVAPEYASTGMLNERSDVYSFGILIMEIISGRSPVDYSRPPGEVSKILQKPPLTYHRVTTKTLPIFACS